MDELLELGSKALRKAALNIDAKEYILKNEILFKTLKKAADRYSGGETLEETIPMVISENQIGNKCSIEFMGESTKTIQEVTEVTDEFLRIVKEIKLQKLHSTISLDLSHIGLNLSKEFCRENLEKICIDAKNAEIEVIVSAEDIEKTDAILDVYKQSHKVFDNIAITLQAYLYRTKEDFQELIREKGRIRIVKGAFETPVGHSISRGELLDSVYLDYVEQLISQNHKCSIATHHHKIQQEAKALIEKYKPNPNSYEFESLYGIQTEQLAALREEGHPTKLYFVYGKEWYLYLCNRIAEHPLNIFRALDDIVA
ncbi:proline dehydrogenase family protein [Leptospira terpstrae]|uniref:proline dehydrogenase n=1 Tax=Leptospira terpstrae serovar Hualin str. LT 11-33 = ATCC 700639 TaxID=1257025 RepID=N1VXL0_9LEPT|nr:proline dehydrogenase family protein [Leptospira terpstrae]EMY60166.1 proline dehydrogenase family protein [Leptospira terpstrae serovar Hualin str. LT 11-33 = ATCC 700639]